MLPRERQTGLRLQVTASVSMLAKFLPVWRPGEGSPLCSTVNVLVTMKLIESCLTPGQHLGGGPTGHGWHNHHGNAGRDNHHHPCPRAGHARCPLCYHGNRRRLRRTGERLTGLTDSWNRASQRFEVRKESSSEDKIFQ